MLSPPPTRRRQVGVVRYGGPGLRAAPIECPAKRRASRPRSLALAGRAPCTQQPSAPTSCSLWQASLQQPRPAMWDVALLLCMPYLWPLPSGEMRLLNRFKPYVPCRTTNIVQMEMEYASWFKSNTMLNQETIHLIIQSLIVGFFFA